MAFLLIVTTFTLTFLCYQLVKILQNYIDARKVGLPILITPFAFINPVWALTEPYLAPVLKLIPFGLTKFVDYSTSAWYFTDRYRLHARYGPVFLIVSPGPTRLIVADASATDDILARRKDFVKPEVLYAPLELFGPNVDTLNGEMWARHRRITTPPFNERNSSLVWKESLAQATGMVKSWMMIGNDGVTNIPNDTMALALHVLTAAGFGKRYEFGAGVQALREGHAMSYRDALKTVLQNLVGAIVTSALFMRLPEWMMPGKVREIKNAIIEFKGYMAEMVEEERRSISKTCSERDNLMSVLLRASESEVEGKGRSALTDEEIFGNLFIYNLAGHDTTANTLAYAVTMLAADNKWQEWIGEEIRSVFSGKDNVENWEYEEAFPRLKRCLALMYETLRLYGPIIFIPRSTHTTAQPLTIQGKEYIIPPETYVIINVSCLNTLPTYWGTDTLIFRPDRWIDEHDELFQPPPGAFVPWASGPRVCPGKKFAQVEFVAVIARLFLKYRVKPKMDVDETREQAEKRILACIEESDLNITLHMRHPESIKLIWEEGV